MKFEDLLITRDTLGILKLCIDMENQGCLTEDELQKAFIVICDQNHVFATHIDLNSSSVQAGVRKKRIGVKPFVPDILCAIRGRLILVELKTNKGKLSKGQQNLISELQDQGIHILVLYGAYQLNNFVTKFIIDSNCLDTDVNDSGNQIE